MKKIREKLVVWSGPFTQVIVENIRNDIATVFRQAGSVLITWINFDSNMDK